MKKKFSGFGISVILLLSFLLTSCGTASKEESASLAAATLYQPPVLRLPAGQKVQTKDGIYQPKQDEVWHSDGRFRQLEQENIDLAAALARKTQ